METYIITNLRKLFNLQRAEFLFMDVNTHRLGLIMIFQLTDLFLFGFIKPYNDRYKKSKDHLLFKLT